MTFKYTIRFRAAGIFNLQFRDRYHSLEEYFNFDSVVIFHPAKVSTVQNLVLKLTKWLKLVFLEESKIPRFHFLSIFLKYVKKYFSTP